MEPQLTTKKKDRAVLKELMKREPIFHQPDFGTSRKDFEKMTDPAFWEVGASGRRYSRDYVLDVLEDRLKNPSKDIWEAKEYHCLELSPNNYLLTYTLTQGNRMTRRTSLWRHSKDGWKIVFHQGTIIADR